jgi:DNA-binding MarR family transcriptional regulator
MASARDFTNLDGGSRDATDGKTPDFYQLLRFSHIFSSAVRDVLERKLLGEVSPYSLTLSQLRLLKLVSLDRRQQVGEVAGFLGVSRPAATKNVDKLERLGLLYRTRSRGDRRATILSVSPDGRRLVSEYEARSREKVTALLEEFTPEELEHLRGLLERTSLCLIRSEDPDGDPCLRCGTLWDEDCSVRTVRGSCPYRPEGGRSSSRRDSAIHRT